MAWSTPKTDWYGEVVDDSYVGDKFNAEDFNRIKNNLEYLRELAIKMYNEFTIHSLGSDKTPKDYFYADEVNKLEANLNTINSNSLKRSYGNTPTYYDNGNTPDFTELNRLEGAILDLYEKLTNEYEGRRTLTWNFGTKGGL
jgi:hypothetical protein